MPILDSYEHPRDRVLRKQRKAAPIRRVIRKQPQVKECPNRACFACGINACPWRWCEEK